MVIEGWKNPDFYDIIWDESTEKKKLCISPDIQTYKKC